MTFSVQGPLPILGSGTLTLQKGVSATHLVSSASGKDSLLGWSQSDGFVHVGVLTKEVLPAWSYNHIPQTTRDADGCLVSSTMVAGSADVAPSNTLSAPPLLLLASVDLALSPDVRSRAPLSLFADPLIPERIFCQHGGGVDSITLRWLPFSDFAGGARDLASAPPLDVHSLLDARAAGEPEPRQLMGLAVVSDSAGETWLVAAPVGGTCVVVPVRSQTPAVVPALESPPAEGEGEETKALSAALAQGPKDIRIPKVR
jgi:nuclear pore complex protein Nup88